MKKSAYRFVKKLTVSLLLAAPLNAATLNVTTNADSGAGSLRQALIDWNTDDIIDCTAIGGQTITLLSHLPGIVHAGTITNTSGSQVTLSGLSGVPTYQAFSIGAGPVFIDNFTIQDCLNKGGDGGSGTAINQASGGGGGAGGGGGIFIANTVSVSLDNVQVLSCVAQGGNGGNATLSGSTVNEAHGAGGGGFGGGNGGSGLDAASSFIGSGGGGNTGGASGVSGLNVVGLDGINFGGASGGSSAAGGNTNAPGLTAYSGGIDGGAGGGGGGAGIGGNGSDGGAFGGGGNGGLGLANGFGGGGAGAGNLSPGAGSGTGGGGASTTSGGNGGAEGGGGGGGNNGIGTGGNGGFGAGGGGGFVGGVSSTGGTGGGGSGGSAGVTLGGGGGGAMGGGIYVGQAAILTLGDLTPFGIAGTGSSTVIAGLGGTGVSPGGNGSASGADIFIRSGGSLILNNTTSTLTFSQDIASNTAAAQITAGGGLTSSGSGTVVLLGNNSFTGSVTLQADNLLQLNSDAAFGLASNPITAGPVTLQALGALSSNRALDLTGTVTINADSQTVTWNGTIAGLGSINLLGPGTLNLAGTNTFSGGVIVTGAALEIENAAALGSSSAALFFAGAGTLRTAASFTIPNNLETDVSITPLIDTQNFTLTLAGTNSGENFSKIGTGTLILTGTNSFTSPVQLVAGSLIASSDSMPTQVDISSTLIFDQTVTGLGSGSFSGSITGAGTIIKQNSGTLLWRGSSSNAGPVFITGGTLNIVADTLGSASFPLTIDNATFAAQQGLPISRDIILVGQANFTTASGASFNITGTISGSGTLTLPSSNIGSVRLLSPNSYTGGNVVNGGVLDAAAPAALQGDTLINDPSAVLFFTSSVNDSYAGNISGSGFVVKTFNNATTTLTGTNTYTGGTILVLGSFQGNTTSIQGNFTLLTGSAGVIFDQAASGTMSGMISGAGSLTKINSGTLTLTGTNSYGGGTNVNAGGLQGNAISLQGPIVLNSNTALTFAQTGNGTYTSTISQLAGTSNVNIVGPGTLTFGGATSNTYNGLTTISGGSLLLGRSGFVAIPQDLLISGGNVQQLAADQISPTANGTISAGQLNLQGFNLEIQSLNYSGGLLTNGGGVLSLNSSGVALRIGDLSTDAQIDLIGVGSPQVTHNTSGSAQINSLNVTNPGSNLTLNINAGNLTLLASSAQGGGLIQNGAGTLTLNSGTHDFTGGASSINGGTLSVLGQLTTDTLTVASGVVLKGNGTITADVTLNGIAEPGTSIGTMNIVGSYLFAPGSTYNVEFNGSTADLINVTGAPGTIVIQPGSSLVLQPQIGSMFSPTTYTLLQTTGGLSGQFSNFSISAPLGIAFALNYQPNVLLLEATSVDLTDLLPPGTPGNPTTVAETLDTLAPAPGTDLGNVLIILDNLNSIEELIDALNQLHPAMLTGLTTVAFENSAIRNQNMIEQRLQQLITTHCISPRRKQGFSLWLDVMGDYLHQNSRRAQPGFQVQSGSAMLGFDYMNPSRFFMGFAGSYQYNNIDWKAARGHGDINSAFANLYTGWYGNMFFIDVTLQGGYSHFNETRHIEFASINRRARANFGGGSFLSSIQTGMILKAGLTEWRPFIATEYLYLHHQAFRESSAGGIDLRIRSGNATMLRSEVGFNLSRCFPVKKYNIRLDGKLSYIRESRFEGGKYRSAFIGTDLYFTTRGLNPDRNLASPGLGLTILSKDGKYEANLMYQAEIGSHYYDQNGQFQFGYRF